MNILWHSNATWLPSGYGTQTRNWCWRLRDAGHSVVISSYKGLEGAPLADARGIVHLPRVREQHSNDIIIGHHAYAPTFFANKQKTDIVFSLIDPFAMFPGKWYNLNWAAQTPVDCTPI